MIRTGCLACLAGLLGWLGWLATGVAAGKTAGQAAGTRHAVSRLFTWITLPGNLFSVWADSINCIDETLLSTKQAARDIYF